MQSKAGCLIAISDPATLARDKKACVCHEVLERGDLTNGIELFFTKPFEVFVVNPTLPA